MLLLEHMIYMWDHDQQHFVVGTHNLIIYVEDIYFLTGLSRRGRLVTLIGPHGGEGSIDDLIDDHCSIGTHYVGGNIPIKHIIDRSLRTVAFTIENVSGTRSYHLTMQAHMLYFLDCMVPTIFNWSEGILVSLKNQLTK